MPGVSNTNKTNNSNAEAANFKIQKFLQSSTETVTTVTTAKGKKPTKKDAPTSTLAKPNAMQNFFLKPSVKVVEPVVTAQPTEERQSISQTMSTDDSEDSDAGYENRQRIRRKKRKNSLRREAVLSVHAKKQPTASEELSSLSLTPSKSSSVKIHTESLILFDEVDIVFREDVGFFAAVNHFIKKSRKPIILTTNDDFLQEKINLNIEKIQFSQPRVDAGVKFLKAIAAMEKSNLDTFTAFKIVHDCKCDMRRAMVQLQALLGTGDQNKCLLNLYKQNAANGTLNMTKHLNKYAFSKCDYHSDSFFFDNLFSLDVLSKRLGDLFVLDCNNLNASTLGVESLTYDLFLIKDGLSDNSTGNSNINNNMTAFNPFLTQPQIQAAAQYEKNNDPVHNVDRFDLTKFNTTYLKQELLDYFSHFIVLFNENRRIDFADWFKHGRVNRNGYASSSCMSRFAQFAFKFTSNSALSLDYRPFLHEMCRIEELKQQSQNKRRYLHYFGNTSNGLTREDYSLLAKSSLDEASSSRSSETSETTTKSTTSMFSDTNMYSDDA
jgi:hypothetical protein